MITLRKHFMGRYAVEGRDGELLGSIRHKFFSPRFTITNRQGDTIGRTDIYVNRSRDFPSTALESTSYILVSAQSGERIATGVPAYNDDVDVTKIQTYLIRPPLADRLIILLQGTDDKFILHVKMNGTAVISGIDKDVSGTIKRLKRRSFSVDLSISDDTMLLCGIFLFTRYLLMENEPIIV